MTTPIVVSVMSRDRVGIVAGVTRSIAALNGEIDAVSQTVLRGYFTIILTADVPDTVTFGDVRRAIERGGPGELAVSVQARDPGADAPVVHTGERFVLTVAGAPGGNLVPLLAETLAARAINILDLSVRREHGEILIIGELMVPEGVDIRALQSDLEEALSDHGVALAFQHGSVFAATNQVQFRHERPAPSGH